MVVLGIESSCDETAAAVFDSDGLKSNVIASQTVHEQFGGVVPELASRAHHKTISATVQQALDEAGISAGQIDYLGVTQGPGLMGSLLVGLCFAKGLSISHQLPLIGINHMDAHIYSNFIDQQPSYPFVALTVSGGHTRLELVEAPFEHRKLGATRDDAAGEAFDKIGKLLGLSYPAGPEIDQMARRGDPEFHNFPQAMKDKGYEFSFSGLKTSVRYFLEEKGGRDSEFVRDHLSDICASVTHAITEVLVVKLARAVKEYEVNTTVLAGGVAANSMLRDKVETMARREKINIHIPKLAYCTDNAAMIAITAFMKAERGEGDDLSIQPYTRLSEK